MSYELTRKTPVTVVINGVETVRFVALGLMKASELL